jgi:hypothetical protein
VAARLVDLGRVAAAHKGFVLQVVLHDGQPAPPKDDTDARRADVVIAVLMSGGAAPATIHAEQAGVREPLVDAHDPRARSRNERLDVAFVSASALVK